MKKPAEIDRRKSSIDILERVTHGFHAPKQRPPVEAVHDHPRKSRPASKSRTKKAGQ